MKNKPEKERHTWLVYAIPPLAAAMLRIVILFLRAPNFFGGDLYTYAVFAHEVRINSFQLPQANTLHFPGSPWIFPPLIPFLAALFDWGSVVSLLHSLTWLEIFLSSLTAIPLVHLSRKIFDRSTALLTGLIYATFPGFVYLCVWGDLAQIASFLIFSVLLVQLHSVVTKGDLKSVVYASLLTVLIGFTHDLTFFVTVFMEFILLLYVLFSRIRNKEQPKMAIFAMLGVLIVGAAGGGLWYFIHYAWVVGMVSGSGRTGGYPILSAAYSSFVLALGTQGSLPYGYYQYSLIFFVLLTISVIYVHRSFKGRKIIVLDVLVLGSIVPMLLVSQDQVLVSRLLYFLYLPYALFGASFLYFILSSTTGIRARKVLLNAAKILAVVSIALYLSFSVVENSTAHVYYVTGSNSSFESAQDVSSWLNAHVSGNETVAAPQSVGFALMALGDLPVLVSENESLLSQPSERTQSIAATVMIYDSFNETAVEHYASLFSIIYIVSNATAYPSYYSLEYTSGNLSVFAYTGK